MFEVGESVSLGEAVDRHLEMQAHPLAEPPLGWGVESSGTADGQRQWLEKDGGERSPERRAADASPEVVPLDPPGQGRSDDRS